MIKGSTNSAQETGLEIGQQEVVTLPHLMLTPFGTSKRRHPLTTHPNTTPSRAEERQGPQFWVYHGVSRGTAWKPRPPAVQNSKETRL